MLERRNTHPELNPLAILQRSPDLAIEQDAYNINVTANHGQKLDAATTERAIAAHRGHGLPAHVYFHLPLCSYVCHFCNYVKRLLPNDAKADETLDRWTSALIEESTRYLDRFPWVSRARVESFFIGGGTASLLGAGRLGRIVAHIRERYDVADGAEFTLEGNPDNFLNDEVAAATEVGFNRFSVGVQSLHSEVNAFAGRGHDRFMSLRAISRLLATGRPFNVDMMFGLPYQSARSVAEDIETLIALRVPTITIYRFRNADRAAMGIGNRSAWNIPAVRDRIAADGLFPSLEETYEMRRLIVDEFINAGYKPSPCGWWSAPGTYPDGNIPRVSRNKWQRYDTMIAYGPGAYGWMSGTADDPVQTHNIADISAYLRHVLESDGLPLSHGQRLCGYEGIGTVLGFAFKSAQPISRTWFVERYGFDVFHDPVTASVLDELLEKGFLEWAVPGESVVTTLSGEAVHEEIITAYFHGRIGGSGGTCRRFAMPA